MQKVLQMSDSLLFCIVVFASDFQVFLCFGKLLSYKLMGLGCLFIILQCPDYFVVGYGMDFAELYRNLPYVGVLKPEHYKCQSP